jgi:hypothetical protein
MNNLAYTSQDPATVGAKVEEKVREEVGASAPLAYQVEMGAAAALSVGSFLRDVGSAIVGGKDQALFHLHFDLPQPRPAQLQVAVNRQGVGAHVGLLLYSTQLAKPVGSEVTLEEPKFFGKSKFTGDGAACGKLNANGELIKRANNFARTESQSGGLTLKIKRCCRLMPNEQGTLLVIGTLPRPVKMGLGAAIDAKDFFDIADMIQATL